MLSDVAYRIYAKNLNRDLRRRGIKFAMCRGVVLLPMPWVPRNMLIGLNQRTRHALGPTVKRAIETCLHERYDLTEEIIVAMCELPKREHGKAFVVKKLPEEKKK